MSASLNDGDAPTDRELNAGEVVVGVCCIEPTDGGGICFAARRANRVLGVVRSPADTTSQKAQRIVKLVRDYAAPALVVLDGDGPYGFRLNMELRDHLTSCPGEFELKIHRHSYFERDKLGRDARSFFARGGKLPSSDTLLDDVHCLLDGHHVERITATRISRMLLGRRPYEGEAVILAMWQPPFARGER